MFDAYRIENCQWPRRGVWRHRDISTLAGGRHESLYPRTPIFDAGRTNNLYFFPLVSAFPLTHHMCLRFYIRTFDAGCRNSAASTSIRRKVSTVTGGAICSRSNMIFDAYRRNSAFGLPIRRTETSWACVSVWRVTCIHI